MTVSLQTKGVLMTEWYLSGCRNGVLVVVLLLWCAAAAAAGEFDELRVIRAQLVAGAYGYDGKASQVANTHLHQMLAQFPGDPLVLVYLGASQTLEGRFAWNPWTKLHDVHRGLLYLGRALLAVKGDGGRSGLTGAPERYEVELVAGNTYLALPALFKTWPEGTALAAKLTTELPQAHWPPRFLAAVYLLEARAAIVEGHIRVARGWLGKAKPLADEVNRPELAALEKEVN